MVTTETAVSALDDLMAFTTLFISSLSFFFLQYKEPNRLPISFSTKFYFPVSWQLIIIYVLMCCNEYSSKLENNFHKISFSHNFFFIILFLLLIINH